MEAHAQPEGVNSLSSGVAAVDAGSNKSALSRDSGEGGSKGFSEASGDGSGSGEQVVVKEQVKAVVGDLENMLGELKTVVGDLRTLVNQIDVVTSKIDEEYGPDGQIIVDGNTNNIEMRTGGEVISNNRYESKVEIEGRSHSGVEMRADKRRRSASMLDSGTPKREVPAFVRHSLSQPIDALTPNPKDWIFKAPNDISPKATDSPRHSNYNNRRKGDEVVCQAHNSSCTKTDNILGTPKKDDIIICTPGSMCHKKEHPHYGTPSHRHIINNKVDLAIYENVPIVSCRTPSKSSSSNSRSPRTSSGSNKGGQSPRTSNSSGIGNSNESANGNTYGSCGKREKSQRHKSHYHHHRHSSSGSSPVAKMYPPQQLLPDGSTTQFELGKSTVTNYFMENGRKLGSGSAALVSVAPPDGVDVIGSEQLAARGSVDQLTLNTGEHHHPITGTKKDHKNCPVPCSPSPDSDYCGVYERELDLQLELIFEEEFDNGVDDRRTLDLQSHPDYGSTYDRERVSRWAAYTLVNIGSMPMSDDGVSGTVGTPCSETSSDILNDNVFITTAAELQRHKAAVTTKPIWGSVFNRYYKQGLQNPDTG